MTVAEQLRRAATRSWWTIQGAKPRSFQVKQWTKPNYCNNSTGAFKHNGPSGSEMRQIFILNDLKEHSLLPIILATYTGLGLLGMTYADSDEDVARHVSSDYSSRYLDLSEIAKNERQRIEDLIRTKGMKHGYCPLFSVAVKGQKVTIKFRVPPTCDLLQLISVLVSNLGLKVDDSSGSDMVARAWNSAIAWQITFNHPEKQTEGDSKTCGDLPSTHDNLCVLMSRSPISSDKTEIEFMKRGSLSELEIETLVSMLQLSCVESWDLLDRKSGGGIRDIPSTEKTVTELESMGIRVHGLHLFPSNPENADISWENIAGYEKQKREIEDTVLLALRTPEVYDDIARGTRQKFESNRPRAVLFEGPPGTGKTSSARVIATQAGVPMLYVPLEVVMSKYYGESERLLGKVFSLANELPNGAIIFLDEVDSLAGARDSEMHEATRRILSVLLRQIDGFEQDKKVLVIAATNRKQDLDPALISRFDSMISFGLPDLKNRQEIGAQYAKHLSREELEELAQVTEGMSGRDIKDVCQQAERSWASKIIRKHVDVEGHGTHLPPLSEYIESSLNRQTALLNNSHPTVKGYNLHSKNRQVDFL